MPKEEYVEHTLRARIVPCPSGIHCPESFRVYEALESHCVPVADDISPIYPSSGYWDALFYDAPFPILKSYTSLPGWIGDILKSYPGNANTIVAWWMRYKRKMALFLIDDLRGLGAIK